jgi:hypothetical protein
MRNQYNTVDRKQVPRQGAPVAPGRPPIPSERWIERAVYDVFAPNGDFPGRLPLATGVTLGNSSGDRIWLIERAEMMCKRSFGIGLRVQYHGVRSDATRVVRLIVTVVWTGLSAGQAAGTPSGVLEKRSPRVRRSFAADLGHQYAASSGANRQPLDSKHLDSATAPSPFDARLTSLRCADLRLSFK